MYHYTESGLDNVYLENGVEITPSGEEYGEEIFIHNIHGLHEAIARVLKLKLLKSGLSFRERKVLLGILEFMGEPDSLYTEIDTRDECPNDFVFRFDEKTDEWKLVTSTDK